VQDENLDAKNKQTLKYSWQINSVKYQQYLYRLQFPCFGVCLCLFRRVISLCKWPYDYLMMESENFRNVGVLFCTDSTDRPRWFQCNKNKQKLTVTSTIRSISLISGLLNSWCGSFLSLLELNVFLRVLRSPSRTIFWVKLQKLSSGSQNREQESNSRPHK
jgi:hypothetical protein